MPEFSDEELKDLFPAGFTGWEFEHASHHETSMMYAIRPDLVRSDLIADDQAARHPNWDMVPAPDEFIPASGVLMHPSDATEDAGRKFLAASASQLVEAIKTEFGNQ
jgi:creatinine amidohydrolase